MAFVRRDFVKETSTVTGTGAITLLGARVPAQTFASVCANGDTFRYAVSNQSGPNEWEVGLGTYNAGTNTITRSPVASSNGGGLVNFSVGTKFVDIVVDTAQYNAFLTTAGGGGVAISASGSSQSAGTVVFSNSNGLSFGMNGSTVTASADAFRSVSLVTFAGALSGSISDATSLTISGSNLVLQRPQSSLSSAVSGANVVFYASGQSLAAAAWFKFAAGTGGGPVQHLSFDNSNAVSFGAVTTTSAGFEGAVAVLTVIAPRVRAAHLYSVATGSGASISAATESTISGSSAVTLNLPALSNDAGTNSSISYNNVFFRFSGSNSVLGAALHRHFGSGIVGGVAAQQVSFANGNSFTFGLTSSTFAGFGVVPIYTLSFSSSRDIGVVSHVGVDAVSSVTQLAFSNASNVTWSLSTAANAATVIASVAAGGGGGITNINVSAGTTSQNLSNVVFSNSNGVSFGLNGSTVTASVATSLTNINVSAGTTSNNLSAFVFSNSNNVSFGLNGSTVTATATVAATRELGVVSHVGGNVVSSVSQLAFSNASNVTFSLSTAANAATVIASVAAAGGGATLSDFVPWAGNVLVDNQYGQNSLMLAHFYAPDAFQFDRFAHPIQLSSAAVTATQTVTMRLGFYTRSASTLSRAASTSFTTTVNISNTNNSTAWSGLRLVSGGWTTTMAAGAYWLGILSSTATAGGAFSLRNGMYSQTSISFSGYLGSASNASNQAVLGQGFFSATTASMPASILLSEIRIAGGGNTGAWRNPAVYFHSGTG